MLTNEENENIAAKREQQRASDRAIAEFLARGGKIQVIPQGKSGLAPGQTTNMWGRGRKKAAAVEEEPAAAELQPVEEEAVDQSIFPENPEDFDLSDEEDQ